MNDKTTIQTIKEKFQLMREKQVTKRDESGKPLVFETNDAYAHRVAENLLSMLIENGQFYEYNGVLCYFDNIKRILHSLDASNNPDNSFQKMLSLHFNFSMADLNAMRIYSRFYPMAEEVAIRTTLYTFSHFERDTNILYVRASNTVMYRIHKEFIDRVPNGTDGVIFRTSNWMDDIDVSPSDVQHDSKFLNSIYFGRIWFAPTNSPEYDRLRQGVMFKKWLYGTFFDTLIPKRPLMVLQGATGTGKTSTLINAGVILHGKNFGAISLPEDKRDLVNSMVNSHLLVLDNVDENPPSWFLDTITAITTGGMLSYRPLYRNVTDPNIQVQPQCFLSVTSRTPEYNRADVANRAIVNTLVKNESEGYNPFKYEYEIVNNRQLIWHYLLGDLQRIVQNLQVPVVSTDSHMRMAEFANFAIGSSNIGPEREYINETLGMVVNTQQQFAAQNKPIIDALKDLAQAIVYPREFTADELLSKLNEDYNMDFRSTRSLGQALMKAEETIKNFVTYEKRTVSGTPRYTIGSKRVEQQTLSM